MSRFLLALTVLLAVTSTMGATPPDEKPKPAAEPKKYSFQFKDVPWDDVLAWYAKTSRLTPILTVKPTGKLTFTPPTPDRQYVLGEITDVLNEAMAPQKLLLIRRLATFVIVPRDGKVDTALVPRIDASELPQRGKTELVQVLIPLSTLTMEDTVPEMKKLLTPLGSIRARGNQLMVTDVAGNVRRIYQMVQLPKDCEGKNFSYRCRWKKCRT